MFPVRVALGFLLVGGAAVAQQYVISTVAGGAPPLTPVSGVKASVGYPAGIATDVAGNVYFTSLNCVFKIDQSGGLTRVAGNSRKGYAGDGALATSAQLNLGDRTITYSEPGSVGVAMDTSGNLYIPDVGNSRVRKVSPAGIITTVAGNGTPGYSGDGGPATSAQLRIPSAVATDGSGNLYIADFGNGRIRKVSPAGIITTVAGNGTNGYSGDGGPATSAQLYDVFSIAVDSVGNVYIPDHVNNRIRRVSSTGIITTVAGNGTWGYSGDGGPATSAQLAEPISVALDGSGGLLIGENTDHIRKISLTGTITTVAGNGTRGYSGDGGSATNAQIDRPLGVAFDNAGNLYIADSSNNRIRKVSSAGIITTIAGSGALSYSGDGGPATSAQLFEPSAVAVDAKGNLYLSDSFRVREVSASGTITTVAGNGTQGYSGEGAPAISAEIDGGGIAVDSVGNLYIADGANNRVRKVSAIGTITTVAGNGTRGYAGDGGPATSAQLSGPGAVAVDSTGNLYIADYNSNNARIRKVLSSGIITTIAGNGTIGYSGDDGTAVNAEIAPSGVAVDNSGNLYVAEVLNQRVRRVSAAGIITTVAGNGTRGYSGDGGPARSAQLANPSGVAVDIAGNLYIADAGNLRIRKVSPAGTITTVAGNGTPGYSGDGGPATSAMLYFPSSVAVDLAGNVYITDYLNSSVRMLQTLASSMSVSAVTSAATNLVGSVSPGEIVVVYGSGLGPAQLVNAT